MTEKHRLGHFGASGCKTLAKQELESKCLAAPVTAAIEGFRQP